METGIEAAFGVLGLAGAAGIGVFNTMPKGRHSALLGVAIFICIAGVVGMGAWPGPWVNATQRAAASVFAASAASTK